MAKYAGQNVHKRLLKEEAYEQKDYQEALKRAFLGTDEDLLAGTQVTMMLQYVHNSQPFVVRSSPCARDFWLHGSSSLSNTRWPDLCCMLFDHFWNIRISELS